MYRLSMPPMRSWEELTGGDAFAVAQLREVCSPVLRLHTTTLPRAWHTTAKPLSQAAAVALKSIQYH